MTQNIYIDVRCVYKYDMKCTQCNKNIQNVPHLVGIHCWTYYDCRKDTCIFVFCMDWPGGIKTPSFFNSTQNVLYNSTFIHSFITTVLSTSYNIWLVLYVTHCTRTANKPLCRIRIHTQADVHGIWTTTRNGEKYLWITVFSTVRNIWFQ